MLKFKYQNHQSTWRDLLWKTLYNKSHAKSIDIVTGGKISRQTVRNKLLRVKVPEPEVVTEKKRMKELHVYADRIIDDLCRGTWDWSVFEREPFMFDGTSGTQILIKGLGQRRNILN